MYNALFKKLTEFVEYITEMVHPRGVGSLTEEFRRGKIIINDANHHLGTAT
jgi:hypothetical protein